MQKTVEGVKEYNYAEQLQKMDVGRSFTICYTVWLMLSIFCTHDALNRYARVVGGTNTVGHWYYPLEANLHTKVFGFWVVPRYSEKIRHLLAVLFLALLLLMLLITSSSPLPPRGVSCLCTVVSVFYFAQARTHGLVHNKADLVPWCLLLMSISSTASSAVSNIRFLMGCVYFSSGVMKLRKTGIKWVEGSNLQRMILQFLLELRISKPNFVQRQLLRYVTLATVSQTTALFFELSFLPIILLGGEQHWCAVGLFAVSFHALTLWMMQIDFLRFWLPSIFSAILPIFYIEDLDLDLAHSLDFIDVLICTTVGFLFTIAHYREHSGEQWPLSSFDLYNVYRTENRIEYIVLNLLRRRQEEEEEEKEVPFNLSICSSSGITRSFGLISLKMEKQEQRAYLEVFLRNIVREECGLQHQYVGVRVRKMVATLHRDGQVAVEYVPHVKKEGGKSDVEDIITVWWWK